MPPKLSPKTHTTSPQAALDKPASRDQLPRGATSNQMPSPNLDPHDRGRRSDGMVAPDSATGVHEVMNPRGGGRRARLDHLRRHSERHRGLGLEDPVENPKEPEGDPREAPRAGLRTTWKLALPVAVRQATELNAAKYVPANGHYGEKHQHEDCLMLEQVPECPNDDGIVRLDTGPHAWHGRAKLPPRVAECLVPIVPVHSGLVVTG